MVPRLRNPPAVGCTGARAGQFHLSGGEQVSANGGVPDAGPNYPPVQPIAGYDNDTTGRLYGSFVSVATVTPNSDDLSSDASLADLLSVDAGNGVVGAGAGADIYGAEHHHQPG